MSSSVLNTREILCSGEERGDFVNKKTNRMVRGYLAVSDNVKPKHAANIVEQGEKYWIWLGWS